MHAMPPDRPRLATPTDAAQHLLRRLVDVRPGETAALMAGFAYFFCLLSGYYLLRPLRDAMGLVGGAGQLQWLFTATFVVMLALVPVFGWLARRWPPSRFVAIIYRFFAFNILCFGALFAAGVQERVVDQVRVRLFSPAKTVVDCFRFRGRPGLGVPVAVAALREFLKLHPGEDARDELRRHAALARMATVMRPYLEALA